MFDFVFLFCIEVIDVDIFFTNNEGCLRFNGFLNRQVRIYLIFHTIIDIIVQ